MFNSGFAFIASHLDLSGTFPLEIYPGHIVRRPREEEINLIKKLIANSTPPGGMQWVNYEAVVRSEPTEGGTSLHFEDLPKEQWKYWILAFDGNGNLVHQLEQIAQLLPVDFDLAFNVHSSEADQAGNTTAWGLAPIHIVDKYTNPAQIYAEAQPLAAEQLASIGSLFRLLNDLTDENNFIKSAIENFYALRSVPVRTGLFVVGLFSIIETLITHQPRKSETLDSINHQITNKIILLRKRYSRRVSPQAYFPPFNEDTIWRKLYDYRSRIAHGGPVTFLGDLQVLRDHDSVVAFLRDNVRELIALALREPEFIADLREC